MVFQQNKEKHVLDVSEYVGNNFKYGYSFQANQRGICWLQGGVSLLAPNDSLLEILFFL